MKKNSKILLMVLVFVVYSLAIPKPALAQQGYISLQVFYDQLNPYGQWVSYPNYGYVWIPDAGPDFSPYCSNGYWIITDYGWTWLSNYPWGWIPFHYGRWDFDDNIGGWFWVPDNEWGPSWVTWRRSNGYYGWTPMRPGITINLSFGNVYRDVDHWNFVRDRDFGRPDMYRYYVNHRDNEVIIRNSVVINTTFRDNRRNVTYITGPQREEVQRYTGRNFRSYTIQDNNRPGQRLGNNRLQIYRPQVMRVIDDSHRPIPSRVVDARDVRPSRERNTINQQNNVRPIQNNRRSEQQPQRKQAQERARPQQPRQDRKEEIQQQPDRRQQQVQPHKKNETGVKNDRRREKQKEKESAPPDKTRN